MLRDIMSQTDLTIGPILALLFFFSFFTATVAWAFSRGRTKDFEAANNLPLDDGTATR
jgi:cbb3-type cytochrome oxidase subunit 3